ncbi:MAG TPA: pilus assembly protein PilM [Phycisphaerae bacterium]|nr:pilus assembly protein PilM [Phycisphaerae bacterium]
MWSWFSRNRYGPIGLDVGTEGVRMLQLERTGDRLSVAAAARWHFPPSALTGSERAQKAHLAAQGVRELLAKGGFHGRQVVSCIPADRLSIKNIRLPHMPEEELAGAVAWECQERFGFEVAPDRIHYINAGEVRQGTESRNEIILVAAAEEVIAEHLEMLQQMRVVPIHVDSEPNALFRTYQRFLRRAQDESVVTVVVDIGLSVTKVVVARGATVVLIKTIDVAGDRFNQCVAKELSLDYEEARHLRSRAFEAGAPDAAAGGVADQLQWSVVDAVRSPVEALAREIGLCLRYCSVTFRGLRPARILLTGGEAYDSALVKLLGNNLDSECVVGEPLRGMDLGAAELGGDRRGMLTEWSTAAGLALRGIVPIPESRKADHERSRVSA